MTSDEKTPLLTHPEHGHRTQSKLVRAFTNVDADDCFIPDANDSTSHFKDVWKKASEFSQGRFNQTEKTGLEPRPIISLLADMPFLVLRHYWFTVLCTTISSLLCCFYGSSHWSLLDPMIFKSMFVVIGFALGFRNANACTRRTAALCLVHDLFCSSWGLIGIFSNVDEDVRKRVKHELFNVTDAIAHHMMMVASESAFTIGLVGLQPSTGRAENPFLESGANILDDIEDPEVCADANFSPATLITQFFFMCEDDIVAIGDQAPLPKNGIRNQKMIRTFWAEKVTFLSSYRGLMHLSVPSVSQRYSNVIDFTLFCFGVSLPWGIHASQKQVDGMKEHLALKAEIWMLMNTLFAIITLLCLNALAVEHEDIVGLNSDDIHMHKLNIMFKTAVEGYEKSRKDPTLSGKTGLEREKALCCSSYDDGWIGSARIERIEETTT